MQTFEIPTVRFESAKAFLDKLFGLASLEPPIDRVYRGHGNASWLLLPNILREGCDWRAKGDESDLSNLTNRSQILREAALLRRFMVLADGAGLPLPEDSQRHEIRTRHERRPGAQP
jgi:hypothetical protein